MTSGRINRTASQAAARLRSVEAGAVRFAAILFALIAMPLSWLVFYAFTQQSGAFTLDNFHRLVSDAAFLDPLFTTFVACHLVRADLLRRWRRPMGWLVARTDMPLRRHGSRCW